jgi:hypothetical protein
MEDLPACAGTTDEIEVVAQQKHSNRRWRCTTIVFLVNFVKLGDILRILFRPKAAELVLLLFIVLCLFNLLMVNIFHESLQNK